MSEQKNPMGKIIADPASVLKAEGVEMPEGISLRVVADTESVQHFVLPAVTGELSDAALDEVAGELFDGAPGSCLWSWSPR